MSHNNKKGPSLGSRGPSQWVVWPKGDEEQQSYSGYAGDSVESTLHVSISNSLENLTLAGPHYCFWKQVGGTQSRSWGTLRRGWIPARQ